ncbi:MAG TPA: DinB family protein [Ktedonobacterales bacterium]
MNETNVTLAIIIEGWHAYQTQLSAALAPLTPEQLVLRAAPDLRSIEELGCHIIGVRAGWFHNILGEGDDAFGAYHEWDTPDAPARTANELVDGLTATWQAMQAALARFTPDDVAETVTGERKGHTFAYKRGWVVWHVLEHDLHHGGEISYSLGMHGLVAPDL